MDHVESHSMRILGTIPASAMKSSTARFDNGDVLYGRLRPYLNKVAQPNFDGLASAEFIVFPDTQLIRSCFLKHRLNAADFVSFASHLNEGDRPRVSFDQIGKFEILIPPPLEQRRIVAKIDELFSELDKGVESLKAARAQLKIYRQAVLKHAFEGKLTAKWREENKDKLEKPEQLLARIEQERETQYEWQLEEWRKAATIWEGAGRQRKRPANPKAAKEPSPIKQEDRGRLLALPDGWAWVRLGKLLSISPQNGVYKPAHHYGGGTQIIRIDDFDSGKLIRQAGFKKLYLSKEEIEKYKIQNADLIINRVNSLEHLGKCALVDALTENTVFESNIMKCSLIESLVSRAYVAAYLSSDEGRSRLCENAKHAVNQASINQTDVGNTFVPIASIEEQLLVFQNLEHKLSQADAAISQIESCLVKAEALRQSILKKAFAGQLVAQDPNDEPASVLLDRIKAEKEQVRKSREITKKTRKKRIVA